MGEFRISGVVRIGGARKSIEEQMKPYLKKARKKRKTTPKRKLDMRERQNIMLDPTRYATQEKRFLSGDMARDQRDLNQRKFASISSRNIINNKTRQLVQDATNLHPQIGYLHPDVQQGVGSQLIKIGYMGGNALTQGVRPQSAVPPDDIYEILGRYDQRLRNTLSQRDKQYTQLAGAFYSSQKQDRDIMNAEIRRLEQKQTMGGALNAEENSRLNSARLKIDQLNAQLSNQVQVSQLSQQKNQRFSDKEREKREILGANGIDKISKTAQYLFDIPKSSADKIRIDQGDMRGFSQRLNKYANKGKNHLQPEDIHDFLKSTNAHEDEDTNYFHLLPRMTSELRRDYMKHIGMESFATDESDSIQDDVKKGKMFARGFGKKKFYEPVGFGDSTDDPDADKPPITTKIKKKSKGSTSGISPTGRVFPKDSLMGSLLGGDPDSDMSSS
jgi:hypothetical protein